MTDVTMPEMDGLELGREFKQRHPHIATIYSSGYAADRANLNSADEDAVILTKGAPSDEMFQCIREVLDRVKPSDRARA